MEPAKSEVQFPLFTHQEKNGQPDYFLCLWNTDPKTFCGQHVPTFSYMIEHLQHAHGCQLRPNIDFCCQQVFQSIWELLEHYLSHIVSSETAKMSLDLTTHGNCNSLSVDPALNSFFEIIKIERQKIINKLLCIPDPEEQEAENWMFDANGDSR